MRNGSKKRHGILAAAGFIVVAGLVGATAAAFALAESEAAGQEPAMSDVPPDHYFLLELPADETMRVWQYRIPSSRYFREEPVINPTRPRFGLPGLDIRIDVPDSGPVAMVEFGVSVDGPQCGFRKMNVAASDITGNVNWSGGTSFRRMLTRGGLTGVSLEPFVDSTNEGPDDRDCVLTMVLSRDVNRCSMYATVSGDVDGLYFGDVAYFNTFDETVPMAAGNAMDPGTMALLDQLLSMAGGVPAGAGGNPPPADAPPPTQDTPPPTQEPPPDRGGIPPATWGEMLQQWAAEDAGDASTPQSGKFGLTLSNVLLPSGGPFGGNAVFSLGAVGPGMEAADAADGFISVPLSRIDLLPGFDAMEGVKFIWEAGKPGSASLTVVPAGENAMIGTLRADLVSERQYGTEGYLEIRLEARFVALRGSLACMQ